MSQLHVYSVYTLIRYLRVTHSFTNPKISNGYLPSRPNISTPRAAKMKNNRKKSRPKFPTCGKACITVSSKALIPLAIFRSLSTKTTKQQGRKEKTVRRLKQIKCCNVFSYVLKGKSLSEVPVFASTNPQYDDGLFIELQVQYMKIPSSNLGRTCCVQ